MHPNTNSGGYILIGIIIGMLSMLFLCGRAFAAEVKWTEAEMRRLTDITGVQYNLPFGLLQAVCEQESRFKLKQVSNKGAVGVCQVLPATVRTIAGGDPYKGTEGVKSYQFGSKGDIVARIQKAVGVNPDRVFGPKTDAAVRLFQFVAEIKIDGIVGRVTWRAMFGDEPFPGVVSIRMALFHPPTNIMWAAEALIWCRNYLGRNETGLMLSCYYSGPGGVVTKYIKQVLDRQDRILRGGRT